MGKPLFSIVTCSYNSDQTIERTIKSILAQDFWDYEYIIVDGKSSDQTMEIVKQYEPMFNGKMHWISEKDKGIYDAMNKGINISLGEYVWLVNSDDYIESGVLKLISGIISNKHPEVITGSIEYFNTKTGFKRCLCYTKKISDREFKKKRMGICHPATIVKKSVYDKYGIFDDRFKIMGDVDWFLRVRENNVRFEFISDKLSNMQEGGVSGQIDTKKRMADWRILYRKHTSNKFEYFLFMIYRLVTYYKHGRKE